MTIDQIIASDLEIEDKIRYIIDRMPSNKLRLFIKDCHNRVTSYTDNLPKTCGSYLTNMTRDRILKQTRKCLHVVNDQRPLVKPYLELVHKKEHFIKENGEYTINYRRRCSIATYDYSRSMCSFAFSSRVVTYTEELRKQLYSLIALNRLK